MLVRQPARGSVGAPSEDAAQIVTLDVQSGQRTQLTRLPGPADPLRYVTYNPRFTGNHTVLFQTISNPDGQHPERFPYRVQTDGSGLGALPTPFALPGAAPIRISPLSAAGRIWWAWRCPASRST